jgi:hypothetical protein
MFGFGLGVLQGKMLELEYVEAVPPMKPKDFSQKKRSKRTPTTTMNGLAQLMLFNGSHNFLYFG